MPPALSRPVVGSGIAAAAGLVWAGRAGGRPALLFGLGLALGAVLLATRFGFAGGYRRWLSGGDAGGVQAQLLLLAATTLIEAPAIAAGTLMGRPVEGAYGPVGVALVVGAALFGIGMAWAGGCGSGTLFAAGGGSPRMAAALAGFVAGSFAGSLHLDWWLALPGLDPVVLGERIGWAPAVALQLLVLAVAARAIGGRPPRRLVVGAGLLALLGWAVLAVQGRPWSITWGFALWGAKLAHLGGWVPAPGSGWAVGDAARALAAPLADDPISMVDLGILAGAALAAAAGGGVRPGRLDRRGAVTAIAGGLLMGYGARLSTGCNIGAFVAGVGTTSLHGWIWIASALPAMALALAVERRLGRWAAQPV